MATPTSENGAGGVTLLWGKFSPFAWRPQVALVEKGIPFKIIRVNMFPKSKELMEANPVHGMIPVLLHDGNPVCESLVILEYIEEAWPDQNPLLPKGALARSKVRFWTDFIDKGFDNIVHIVRGKLGRPPKDSSVEKVPKFFETLEGAMVEYSADGPFFTGDNFGYLDVVMAPLCRWPKLLSSLLVESPLPGPDKLPRLNKWVKAMEEYESVKDTLPSEDENLEFFEERLKQYREKVKAEAAGQK